MRAEEAQFIANVVSCTPEEFDAVYDAGIEAIKAAGADKIVEALREQYKLGNYTGTYPGK